MSLALPHPVADSLLIARRNLTHVRHVPEKLLDVTVQPIMFVVLFAFVFGSAIAVPGDDYRSFLMAGIFVQTLAFGAAGAAVGVAEDMSKGIVDRFRTLPMARSAVLTGQSLAELAANAIGIVVLAITGLIIGWHVHGSVASVAGAFALLLLFAFAMGWVGTLVGLSVRAPDAAQGVMFIVLFPLTFVANTFVPTDGLPRVLQVVAEWNPVSAIVAACRDGFGNAAGATASGPWPLEHPVLASVGWCLAIIAVCLPLSVAKYRRAATQ